jgi:hypothetical protein
MPVILATQEAEISRIVDQSQPGKIVCETLSRKKPIKKRAGRVTQGGAPEYKPQYQPPKNPTKQKKVLIVLYLFPLIYVPL